MDIYKQISSNKRKSFFLIFLFFGFVIALGAIIGLMYGSSYFGIVFAIIIGTLYFLLSYYSGSSMILKLTRAKEASRQEYAHYINTIDGLAIAAGIPKPKAYIIKDSALNAFATGRDPEHAAITVTTGLLDKMNRIELEGVIAHEMAHIKNYDIRVMMLAAVMVGLTVLLSDFILRSFLFGGARREHNQLTLIFVVVGLVLAVMSPFIGEIIKLAISRKREFLADAEGAFLTRHPKGLADALRKIQGDPDPLVDYANKATAHLFISTPFRKKKGLMVKLFATHPPIEERISALDAM